MYTIESQHYDFQLRRIIVFDLHGNQVVSIEQPSDKQLIDLSDFADGIYLISAIFDKDHPPVRMKLFKS